ncbi:MAG: RluA family pseudouridine synthase [Alphaproteobacteria bacterium]
MSAVQTVKVSGDEADQRLDRWFKRRFPTLGHGKLEKLLRTGQVRVDGKRAKAAFRLEAGMEIRVPPLDDALAPAKPAAPAAKPAPRVSKGETEALRAAVLHKDEDVIVINKPPGLAVQGGTGTSHHLDGMLDALKFDKVERPRLVHRLDRDTSGALVLARSAAAARWLAEAFKARTARKVYWALVVGVPKIRQGKIDMALAKLPGPRGERMVEDEDAGKRAITLYTVIENAAHRAAWLAMMPLTGRTHQLRAHAAALNTPILGDGKYGGEKAFFRGPEGDGGRPKLHLHAREIAFARPDGKLLKVVAPLPAHMKATWDFFGFDANAKGDPFADADL